MKTTIFKISVLVLLTIFISSCATILHGDNVSECQRTRPPEGQPSREVRIGPLLADIFILFPASMIIDFATGAIYKPCSPEINDSKTRNNTVNKIDDDPYTLLPELKKLVDEHILTQEEFELEKDVILKKTSSNRVIDFNYIEKLRKLKKLVNDKLISATEYQKETENILKSNRFFVGDNVQFSTIMGNDESGIIAEISTKEAKIECTRYDAKGDGYPFYRTVPISELKLKKEEKAITKNQQITGDQRYEKLKKLKELLDAGIINQSDFDAEKKKILAEN